jgi:hypothetical protein
MEVHGGLEDISRITFPNSHLRKSKSNLMILSVPTYMNYPGLQARVSHTGYIPGFSPKQSLN